MTLPATRTGVLARKVGMTRVFDAEGRHVPVTVLSLEGCQVVGVRTEEARTVKTKKGGEVTRTDGYKAVIMGAGDKKAKRTVKALRGQFAKAGVAPKAKLKEFAGDIVALAGLKETTTGDTVCDVAKPVVLETMTFPDPVIEIAVEPKSKADQEKMSVGLQRLAAEDPSFRVETDFESGQTIMKGMGELHLDILIDRL